jgi:CDGSH-type Zn-finger protein
MLIRVTRDGPYVVTGGPPLSRAEIVVDENGESVGWCEREHFEPGERYTLCRCGRSHAKPYCDGAHVGHFDGTETAGHGSYAEMAVELDARDVNLRDARQLCADARFCVHAGGLWNLVNHDDEASRRLAEEEAKLCPAGRYVVSDRETGEDMEPEFEPSIVLIEDPHLGVSGPIFVRGRIPIVDEHGKPYEVRNRVTLCRCGASKNMPFCDGSHIKSGFKAESAGP